MAWFKNYLGVCSVAGLVVAPCSRAVLEAVKKIADKPKDLTGTIACRCLVSLALSTGASREAPVDNACFSGILPFSGLGALA